MRDQRSMTGSRWRDSLDQIEAVWQRRAEKARLERPAAWEGRTALLHTGDRVEAYVSHDRWVADCPGCNGGIACWDQNPRGCCLGCGRVYTVVFPKEKRLIEQALAVRPKTQNRSWLLGETVDQLTAENVQHLGHDVAVKLFDNERKR